LAPPPEATQKVSEMQDSEVNPPPGGRVVSEPLQPGACSTGTGTVVGVADGGVVVDGEAVVTGALARVDPLWSVGADDRGVEHPASVMIRAAQLDDAASRPFLTCPLHMGVPARPR
jgi:hypothetical protein